MSRGMRFAELWMGTHPSGPSSVLAPYRDGDTGANASAEVLLKDLIVEDPAVWLGEDAAHGDLPFLFKVLSVRQALSIQAHPSKQLAQQLHHADPTHYPDANHKPEICIPLGDFEALCAFRPREEIHAEMLEVPELQWLSAPESGSIEGSSVQELFSRLMRSDPMDVGGAVRSLVARLEAKDARSPRENLVLRLERDYPGDVGIFSSFFLNYVRIEASEANRFIFCAPNEPHAYLSGDCVECMAISDNVIRAGLTSKFKDVETLLGCMSYRDDLLGELVGEGERIAPGVLCYAPPVDDFVVYQVDGSVVEGLALPRAAICACLRGPLEVEFAPMEGNSGALSRHRLSQGNTLFCRADTRLTVGSTAEGAKLFIATYRKWPIATSTSSVA